MLGEALAEKGKRKKAKRKPIDELAKRSLEGGCVGRQGVCVCRWEEASFSLVDGCCR